MVQVRMAVVLAVLAWMTTLTGSLQAQDSKERRKPEGCTHDFSKFREAMKLTEDQKARIEEIKNQINGETKGINRCVIQHMMEELKDMAKDSDAFKQKRQEIEKKREAMQAAMKKFEESRMSILTAEQKKAGEEFKAMMKEHHEQCMKGDKKGEGKDHGPHGGEGKGREHDHSECTPEEALKEGVFHHHEGAHHDKDGHKGEEKN